MCAESRMNRFAIAAIAALVACGIPSIATRSPAYGDSSYAIFDLGTMQGSGALASGINESCQVVGTAKTAIGNDRAFLWEAGGMKPLRGVGEPCASEAFSINDAGQIVGEHGVASPYCEYDALFWDQGVLTDIGSLAPGLRSWAYALNSSGEVTGRSYTTGAVSPSAILWLPVAAHGLPAGLHDLGALSGAIASEGRGINARGEVVGWSIASSNPNAHDGFIWLPSGAYGLPAGMTNLGSLGGTYTRAWAINELGQVVGDSVNGNGYTVAFLWLPAAAYGLSAGMHDMQTSGGAYSFARAINSAGDIVGLSATNSPPPREECACAWFQGQPGAVDLNALLPAGAPWILRSAQDINDKGQIVGWGLHNLVARAFLLSPLVNADFDADGDVDLFDYRHLQDCLPAAAELPREAGCDDADLNNDGSIDLADAAELIGCLGGPGKPALLPPAR